MKNIFHGLLIIAPFAALILFFAIVGKEEVKSEQRVQDAVQALQEQQFDDQFSDAWNGVPGAKIKAQRNEHIADLKNKADQARAKRDELDGLFNDATTDMREAIAEEDARLGAASSVKRAGVTK